MLSSSCRSSIAFLAILGVSSLGFGASTKPTLPEAKKSNLNKITSISGESDQKTSNVNVLFDKKPDWSQAKIEAHGTFLQIILPKTIVPNPGEFFDGKSPYIRKIAAFQIGPETAAVRLFVEKEADVVLKALSGDVLDTRYMVTLDHDLLTKALKADPTTGAAGASMPTAEQIVAKTEVDHGINPAMQLMKEGATSGALKGLFKPADDLTSRLYKIAFFLGVMLAGTLLFFTLRQVKRRTKGSRVKEDELSIKTIASHSLAPKHKLTLVQVGDEKILLGITPDNINLIKAIENPQHAPRLTRETPKTLTRAKMPAPKPQPKQLLPKFSPQRAATSFQVNEKEAAATSTMTSTFEARVDDDGITETRKHQDQTGSKKKAVKSYEAINDVTRLIREKLKNLPAM